MATFETIYGKANGSARRGAKMKRDRVEVLPPERPEEEQDGFAGQGGAGLRIRIDAAHLRVVALAARRALAESQLTKILRDLKRSAQTGAMETIIQYPDQEGWRAKIALEALAEPLHRLGFMTKPVVAPFQRSTHYEPEQVPGLYVAWGHTTE